MKGNKLKKHTRKHAKKRTDKVEMNTAIYHFYPKVEAVYEYINLTDEPTDEAPEKEAPKKSSKDKASLNLELALIIALLVLSTVFGLQQVGSAINTSFLEAAGALEIAGGTSGPTNGSVSPIPNPDGSYDIGWDNGTPPYEIVRATLPDMSDQVVIGTTPETTYTIPADELQEGDNYIGIIDDGGRVLTPPIVIVTPNPPTEIDHETFDEPVFPDNWAFTGPIDFTDAPSHGTWAIGLWTKGIASFERDFDLSDYSTATLTYWTYREAVLGGMQKLKATVDYSTDGGNTWTVLESSMNSSEWSEQTYSLPTGGVLRLRFSGSLNYTPQYILWDDICVEGVSQ